MHIDQLKYIVEVAKTGSISRAAENLHVSSATISQSISNIEKKLEVKLFKRSRLGTVPSDEGKKIIEKAYEIVIKSLELEKEAEAQTTSINNELKLVCNPASLLTFLPKSLSTFKKNYPNVNIEIKEQAIQPNILEEVNQDEVDFGFISVYTNPWLNWGKDPKKNLHFETLAQGRIYVCVSKDSLLAFKDEITPEELLDKTMVLHTVMRPIIDDIIYQYGTIKILFESNNSEIIKKMVCEGLGISFFSDLFLKNDFNVLTKAIVLIPLVNYERSNLTYGWVRSKRRLFSATARDFLKTMKQEISNMGF